MTANLNDVIVGSGVEFGTSGARGPVVAMTDRICYAYVRAFLGAVASGCTELVIGHDLRPSSPAIAAACAAAARDAYVQVRYLGALPTPAVAYYAAVHDLPALIVTGSHIPFDRNGIKFYGYDGEITKADEQAMLGAAVDVPDTVPPCALPACSDDGRQAYIRRYTEFFQPDQLSGMRVAIYEHSSVGRDILRDILEALGATVIALGRVETFVPIDTEAVSEADIARGRNWAVEHDFDAIISTDGDADRPLIGDERGNWLRGDLVGILCAQWIGTSAVVTPISSNSAVDKCGLFRKVLKTRIGSPYVIEAMQRAKHVVEADGASRAAVIAGYEANGGFLLGSALEKEGRHLVALPTRDAVLPILAVLAQARERGQRVSELAATLPPRFTHSDRIQNIRGTDSQRFIVQLAGDLSTAAAVLAPDAGELAGVDTTDGFRVTFSNGDTVHIRPSGNAPELRCYTESDTQQRARMLCIDCLDKIRHALSPN